MQAARISLHGHGWQVMAWAAVVVRTFVLAAIAVGAYRATPPRLTAGLRRARPRDAET